MVACAAQPPALAALRGEGATNKTKIQMSPLGSKWNKNAQRLEMFGIGSKDVNV